MCSVLTFVQYMFRMGKMSKPCLKITPKLYLVAFIATFVPLVYISIIDQSFRLSINRLPEEVVSRKLETVKSDKKHDEATKPHVNGVHKIQKGKLNGKGTLNENVDKNPGWKKGSGSERKQTKLDGKVKNNSRYLHKTHRNSSAVLGDKEKQFRLCPLLPKRLGKIIIEPVREKTNNLGSHQVRHKPGCTITEEVGSMTISPEVNTSSVQDLNSLRRLERGGHYKPHDCEPREKTAVIIPYRDRAAHLEIVVHHLHSVLQRQDIEYGIYVIEMAYPTQFNKGLLSNIGFLTAASIHEFTCYVIHDVDLLPADDRNIYRCGRVPRHLIAFSSKFSYNLPYLSYFGGAVAFTPDQFWKVNGYSNLYFGWGGEDDDIVTRIVRSGMHFSRPRKIIGGFVALKHGKDAANPLNPHRAALRATSGSRKDIDGVRTVKYNRLALEFKDLYTWVFIGVKEAEIMKKYEEYLQLPG